MKNYLIFAMILIAGMTAYPQATRSARETKTEKSSAKREAKSQQATRTQSRSGSERRAAANPARTRTENRSASTERSTTRPTRTEAVRPRVETRGTDQNAVRRSTNEASGRRENRSENRSGSGISTSRDLKKSGNNDNRNARVNTSSATRVFREGNGTLTRDDGTVVRHQNDEVFKSRKYRLDYDNYENLRRSDDFRRDFRDYDNWFHRRIIRNMNHYNHGYIPLSFELRRHRYYYRQPFHIDLIWTPLLFHRFMYYYPTQNNWDMEFGSQIETISADEAQNYAGSVRRVYGKVAEVFYSPEDENYILYIGAPFPYQDASIVVPKQISRSITLSPKWYFEDEYIWVVGLINMWEGKPEIIIRDEDQIRKY